MAEFKQLNRKQYNALSKTKKEEFKKAYVAHHLPMFKKHCEGTGLNPEMLLAQTAKESQYGISGLSYTDFNYGGKKYYGDINDPANVNNFAKYNTNEDFKTKAEADAYKKKQEAKGFTTKHVKKLKAKDGTYYYRWRGQQAFKKFANAEDGIKAQVEFFSKSPRRYKNVGKIEDPYEQMEAIKNAGYATDSTGTYVSDIIEIYDDITKKDGKYYSDDLKLSSSTLSKVGRATELGLQEEYEKYVNELGIEGDEDKGEIKTLSYEEWYKEIDAIGSPKAQKLKRQSLQDLGPRVVKTEEKKEDEVVGKVDEDGKLILTPTPIVPRTTISDEGEVDFGGHIQKRKDELKKKKEEENKKKEKVYQKKELVPLSDLTEEEISNLTNEEKKEYGLQPTIDIVEDKKVKTEMIDKDGDGIPDTIDADAGEATPENQLTVSTEEQVVIDEQEKEEAIETVETEEMEVLDANGNIKKITVPTEKTPTTVETEGVVTEDVVEEKPELVKPKLKDFKTSSDYMRARMKYFKSVEDQDELDFDNELDDDEIKEVVDMEQNSAVIDASKRNIFKTNGKSNIFNSIIGDIDNLAKGIQQELNNITKSINNRD